ncbi:MAG TPA: hypothetical protein VK081_12820, partial [Planctomycetota bacterium]|nr:hypothetical protein [Planctomycetota bacterium]
TWSYPTSDAAPLGSHPAIQTVEEGRWQALIPHTHLPTTPVTIVGFSVISETFGGPLTYRTLRVTLGHTSASALGTDFAANLIAPVAVIDRTNHAVNYRLHAWTRVPFDVPFAYDGRSSLVLEIRKECVPIAFGVAAMATAGAPPRTELPLSRFTVGAVGSGAASASTATAAAAAPLQVQLHVQGAPTIFLTSYPQATRNEFPLGGTIDFACDAQAGAVWVGWIGGTFVPRLPVPGFLGEVLVPPAAVLPARTVATAPDVVTLGIPSDPWLVGVHLAWQGVVVEPGRGPLFTNGANCVIRP